MADIAKFIEEIKGMTVVELNELVKALEEEFGVSAAAPVAVAAAPAAGAAAPAEEEKTEFDVKLKDIARRRSRSSRLSVSSLPSALPKRRLSSSPSAPSKRAFRRTKRRRSLTA